MERTRWWAYVERLMNAAGWKPADLARATGVDQSVIGRWRNKAAMPEPDSVRAVAKAFGRDVREAAVEAEMFTAAELMGRRRSPVIDPETFDLSVFSNKRLVDEALTRMERGLGNATKPWRPRTRQRAAAHADRTSIPASSGRDSTLTREESLAAPPGVERDGDEVSGSSARPA